MKSSFFLPRRQINTNMYIRKVNFHHSTFTFDSFFNANVCILFRLLSVCVCYIKLKIRKTKSNTIYERVNVSKLWKVQKWLTCHKIQITRWNGRVRWFSLIDSLLCICLSHVELQTFKVLRKQARQSESEIESKLVSFSKLCITYTTSRDQS